MAKCGTRTLDGCARWWCLLVAVGSCWGCSSQSDETKRQLELLNERMLILQNDRDRLVERVDALEQHTVAAPPSVALAQPQGRPQLKVVHLAPDNVDNPKQAEPSLPDGEIADATNASAENEPSSEPPNALHLDQGRVVLYGEGQSSGVRAPAGQELR